MKIIVSILLSFMVFCSCVRDSAFDSASYKAKGNIPVNLTLTSVDEEVAIKKMRILVFESHTKRLISNTTFTNIAPSSGYKVSVESGENDFYVVANETDGMADYLKSIGSVSDLDLVLVDHVPGLLPLPLFGSLLNVNIKIPEGGGQAIATPAGGVATTVLAVSADRLMAKLNFTFIKNIPASSSDFTISEISVSVKRTPKYSFLLENKPYTATTQWADEIHVEGAAGSSLSNNGQYIKKGNVFEVPEGLDHITIKDVYIPEYILEDKENKKLASYLVIHATFVNKETSQVYKSSYRLDLSHGVLNHNLYRNNQYDIYATIVGMGAIGLHASIVPMKIKEISVGWTPYEGLVIVSDLVADYGKNKNVWNTYTQYSGILKIGSNEKYRDVLFKYGSVLGISNDDASTAFDPAKSVVWRPISFSSAIAAWGDVPFMPSGTVQPNTPENIKKGIGDPCRLVALSAKQIASGIVDNNAWRMATSEEYKQLIAFKDLRDFDNKGFYSVKYFLIPGAKTRNEAGAIYSLANTGEYWASDDLQCLQFDATTSNQVELLQDSPQKGFSIRCVRTDGIPPSSLNVTGNTIGSTGGASSIGVRQAGIPFWMVSLLAGDASAITLPNPSEGRFDGQISIDIAPLPNPYVSRSFTLRVIGYGIDGKLHQQDVVIRQLILEHSIVVSGIVPAPVSANGYLYVPKEGGDYVFHSDISPEPAADIYSRTRWKSYVRPSTFKETEPDIEGTVATSVDKKTTVTIPENTTGDVRVIHVIIKEESGIPPNVRSVRYEFIQPGK